MRQQKFQLFDKYDFVKSYVSASVGNTEDLKIKEQKERGCRYC